MPIAPDIMRRGYAPAAVLVGAVLLVALFVALRPAIGGPEERSFDVRVSRDGMEPREIVVNEGDTVNLRLSADHELSFHLHGYDLEADFGPGKSTSLRFVADRTGRFTVEDERTSEEIGALVVQPR